MKNLLGGKGCGLAEMSNLGLPVPPGLTITTEVCTYFYRHGKSYPPDLREQVADGLAALEQRWAPGSAMPTTRCWFQSARELAYRCPG